MWVLKTELLEEQRKLSFPQTQFQSAQSQQALTGLCSGLSPSCGFLPWWYLRTHAPGHTTAPCCECIRLWTFIMCRIKLRPLNVVRGSAVCLPLCLSTLLEQPWPLLDRPFCPSTVRSHSPTESPPECLYRLSLLMSVLPSALSACLFQKSAQYSGRVPSRPLPHSSMSLSPHCDVMSVRPVPVSAASVPSSQGENTGTSSTSPSPNHLSTIHQASRQPALC